MRHRAPSRLTLIIPALVCLAISAVMAIQLARQMREDLYWTPLADSPGLEAARPRAEVMIDGVLLQDLIEEQQLRLGGRPVPLDSVRVRFNNVDAVTRAQMIILAALLGAGASLLGAAMLLPSNRGRHAQGLAEAPQP